MKLNLFQIFQGLSQEIQKYKQCGSCYHVNIKIVISHSKEKWTEAVWNTLK